MQVWQFKRSAAVLPRSKAPYDIELRFRPLILDITGKAGTMKTEFKCRRIFTLIELLIVIAIIAILLTSESIFFMSVYVNGVLGKV